ncbi:MAG: hypothetical protein L6R48_04565 [Planctomycetes bacterium]|nr:hypothetical protein [Planctomycetota bacterium]
MDDPEGYEEAKRLLAAGDPAGRARLAALAAGGHPPACFREAELRLEAGEPGAVELLRTAAGAGHARACFRLGLLHAKGAGVAQDLDQARRWCELAARGGLAVAQFNLGLLHHDGDPDQAAHWLHVAAANGVAEAEACLDLLWERPGGGRPRTWDEAGTRASVVLGRSDAGAPKSVRFAEYYLDPCLDLLARRMQLRSDETEDIVQQFFLELEQPLAKGAHRGRPWKDALRGGYDPARGRFRPYLGRALVNFARDWIRAKAPPAPGPSPADPGIDPESHRHEWAPLLARWRAEVAPRSPAAARAGEVVEAVLAEGAEQAAIAARLGVVERTVRRDAQLGAELLQEWIEGRLGPPPAEPSPLDAALRRGCALVPEWLHRPSADKRARLLCYLALVARTAPA